MKDKQTQMWIPLYVDKWIFGSTRIELEPAERGVFIDLMVLAAKDSGYIRANETTPYLPVQIAGLLNIPVELMMSTMAKCIHFGKIEEPTPGIYRLMNWGKYQFTDRYKRILATSSEKAEQQFQNSEPIRKDRIGKEKKEHTTTAAVATAGPVNWDNCKSDLQRFLSHYIKSEMPDLYVSATKEQANGLFKRYGRAASEILAVAGSLNLACRAFDLARAYFTKKGLSWNLSTVSANIAEFVNEAIKDQLNGTKHK